MSARFDEAKTAHVTASRRWLGQTSGAEGQTVAFAYRLRFDCRGRPYWYAPVTASMCVSFTSPNHQETN